MSAAGDAIRRWWRAFGTWRRLRPFWGGVFTIAGALELAALSAAPLHIYLIRGLAGVGTLVIAAMLVALAVISWTHTHLRVICGVFIVILGLASFAVSNLGGFFVGLMLCLVGGSLIYAWVAPKADPGHGDAETPATGTRDETAETDSATDTPRSRDDGRSAEADVAGPGPQRADRTGPKVRPSVPATAPSRAGPGWPRLAGTAVCVIAVVAGTSAVGPGASAGPAAAGAEPTWSWSWPWPSPTDGTSSPDESDEPPQPGDDDPGKPDPEKPEGDCDRDKLPDKAPKLGTEEAEAAAKAVAACLTEPGSSQVQQRDLPTVSAIHPVLKTEVMTMNGLEYGGVVAVHTNQGDQRALEFTMDTLDLAEMDQSAGIDGTDARLHVINRGGSAVLSGSVRLYVQRMEGLIFGVVPIVLTADTPPPLIVPYLVVTEATVTTAYTRANTVDIPSLHEPTR